MDKWSASGGVGGNNGKASDNIDNDSRIPSHVSKCNN